MREKKRSFLESTQFSFEYLLRHPASLLITKDVLYIYIYIFGRELNLDFI